MVPPDVEELWPRHERGLLRGHHHRRDGGMARGLHPQPRRGAPGRRRAEHRGHPVDLPLEDAIEDEREARVALHTRTALVPAIVERAKTEHPCDVPCVIALPIPGRASPGSNTRRSAQVTHSPVSIAEELRLIPEQRRSEAGVAHLGITGKTATIRSWLRNRCPRTRSGRQPTCTASLGPSSAMRWWSRSWKGSTRR